MKELFFARLNRRVFTKHKIWVYCYKCGKGVTAEADDVTEYAVCPYCGTQVSPV